MSFKEVNVNVGGPKKDAPYTYKEVILKPNKSFAEQVTNTNRIYVIKWDFDLGGEEVTIPENCILKFDGGSVSNGTVNCASQDTTLIKFNNPFIGNNVRFVIDTDIDTIEDDHGGEDTINTTKVSPYTFDKDVFIENEIFKTVNHSQEQLEIMINASMPGKKIITEKATYVIDTIKITRDINIDFSGSTIIAMTYNPDSSWVYCSARAFYMKKWVTTGIKSIVIKNAIIDGYRGHNTDNYPFRRAIQIFNVDNVVLDNVKLQNYYLGNNAQYTEDINRRYELATVAIMNGLYCSITNCSRKDFAGGEGFWVCPKKDIANFTVFSGNETGNTADEPEQYIGGSFLTIIDGRCLVENNIVKNYKDSAFNLFCYNSIIRNNIINNSQRSIAVDLTEGGLFISHNVEVYGNKCDNIKGFIDLSGSDFNIHNNIITNPNNEDTSKNNTGSFVRVRDYVSSPIDYVNTQINLKHYTNVSYPKNIVIQNNNAQMQYFVFSAVSSGNRNNIEVLSNKFQTIPVLINDRNWGIPIRLFYFIDVCIKDNIFDDTYNYSTESGKAYIRIGNSQGHFAIINNRFAYRGNDIGKSNCEVIENTSNTNFTFDVQNNISMQEVLLFNAASELPNDGISILLNNINMYYTAPVGDNVIRPKNLTEFTGDNSVIKSKVFADSYIIEDGIVKYPQKEGWAKFARTTIRSYFFKNAGITYSDNSVWLVLNTGKKASAEPDVSGKILGDIITDGDCQMKKVADNYITFEPLNIGL